MNGDINVLEVTREPEVEIARLPLLNSKRLDISTPLIHEMNRLLFPSPVDGEMSS